MPETLLTPILDSLRACLCDALTEHGGGDSCFCGLYPGAGTSADWCGCGGAGRCGMAWVRLDRMFPAGSSFPNPDTTVGPNHCNTILAATIEVGVYRCVPVPNQDGTVDPVALTNAALTQYADAMAMVRAIRCCPGITKRPHLLGTYLPVSGGDCGGGTWPVTVQLLRV